MKRHKHIIIAALIAMAIPLSFWCGVKRGNSIDTMLFAHGTELIRLQNDIKGLQIHVAEMTVENHRLRTQINEIETYQDTIRIHLP